MRFFFGRSSGPERRGQGLSFKFAHTKGRCNGPCGKYCTPVAPSDKFGNSEDANPHPMRRQAMCG